MAARAPMLVPMGGLLMTVLTQGSAPGTTATAGQLFSWVSRAGAQFTTTLDSVSPQVPLERFFMAPRDTMITIDLRTMTIVDLRTGEAGPALDHLQMLLSM